MAFEIAGAEACCEAFKEKIMGGQVGDTPTGVRCWWDIPTGQLVAGVVWNRIVINHCPWCGVDWNERLRQAALRFILAQHIPKYPRAEGILEGEWGDTLWSLLNWLHDTAARSV